ncbi:MAG: PadR family transcriptional regulator [Bacteroidota bacterium]
MKGTNLGELEEIVMLSIAILYDEAYGIAIQQEIKKRCNRSITISTVHSVTSRLEEKGFLNARYDGATPERGGRRKRLFRLTKSGQVALSSIREIRNGMWDAIPKLAFGNG